jgi:hypothetical protein
VVVEDEARVPAEAAEAAAATPAIEIAASAAVRLPVLAPAVRVAATGDAGAR